MIKFCKLAIPIIGFMAANTYFGYWLDNNLELNLLLKIIINLVSSFSFSALYYGGSELVKKIKKNNNAKTTDYTATQTDFTYIADKIHSCTKKISEALDELTQKFPNTASCSSHSISDTFKIAKATTELEQLADSLTKQTVPTISDETESFHPTYSGLSLNLQYPLDSPSSYSPKALNILIVDDSFKDRSDLQYILNQQLGHKVTTATNGKEAVELMSTYITDDFDIIFLGLDMPIMGGIEAAKIIRQQFSKEKLPIIAYVGSNSTPALNQIEEANINDIIVKSVTLAGIKAVLARLLKIDVPMLSTPEPTPQLLFGYPKKDDFNPNQTTIYKRRTSLAIQVPKPLMKNPKSPELPLSTVDSFTYSETEDISTLNRQRYGY